jgi:hypothetical protein
MNNKRKMKKKLKISTWALGLTGSHVDRATLMG